MNDEDLQHVRATDRKGFSLGMAAIGSAEVFGLAAALAQEATTRDTSVSVHGKLQTQIGYRCTDRTYRWI